jgi:diguanylate cyclase (GGDEF)-like protein/PAS domain S-box-containing protein
MATKPLVIARPAWRGLRSTRRSIAQPLVRLRDALPKGRPLSAEVWARRHRMILGLLWLHAAVVWVFGSLTGNGIIHSLLEASILIAAAGLAGWRRRGQRFRAVLASLGLLTASGLLVHLSGGYIELHFHFFVMVAIIALYQDWATFLAAIGYVVLHHGLMGVLAPHGVYNHPAAWANPWLWAAIHGAFILAMSAACLVNWRFNEAEVARRLAEQERAEQRLRNSAARFQSLVQNATDIITIVDAEGIVRYASPSHQRVLGLDPAAIVGESELARVHPDDRPWLEQVLYELRGTPGADRTFELRVRHRDESWRTLEMTVVNLLADPSVAGIVANARDVTERKVLEEQLAHQAFHDSLTGLPNRALFMDRLTHGLVRANRSADPLVVLYLDLDHFKVVNDSLGHKSGDQLLVAVGQRLAACLRPGDTIARLGGDEFTILLDGADIDQAVRVAERILDRLSAPIALDGREVVVGASIGIAPKTSPEDRPDDLLRNADIAMYTAKHNGKAHFAIFDAEMQTRAWKRLELESDLRLAVEQGQFRVYYQPIVRLATGEAVEVEALVRWEHPARGLVSPTDFVPLAEETGLILPIGWWVLREACRQARAWHVSLPSTPALTMSVNLSPRMFQHPSMVEDLARILQETDLDPGCLKLEITEGIMMQNGAKAMATLARMRALGVKLAIDDFGTGYSSLAYLQHFPVDVLKIDRSFVARLGQGLENRAIVRTIVGLAETLGLSVVGEGVETEEQLASLQELGCDIGQGYYFSRPVPADEAGRWLAAARARALPWAWSPGTSGGAVG